MKKTQEAKISTLYAFVLRLVDNKRVMFHTAPYTVMQTSSAGHTLHGSHMTWAYREPSPEPNTEQSLVSATNCFRFKAEETIGTTLMKKKNKKKTQWHIYCKLAVETKKFSAIEMKGPMVTRFQRQGEEFCTFDCIRSISCDKAISLPISEKFCKQSIPGKITALFHVEEYPSRPRPRGK